jgi:hypothetical protein
MIWSALAAAALIFLALSHPKLQHRLSRSWIVYRDPAPVGIDEVRVRALMLSAAPIETRFEGLFQYFAAGFVRHVAPGNARVQYGGAGSGAGPDMDGLEGFSRTAPLLAAWIYSGRVRTAPAANGATSLDVIALLRSGILTGVNRESRDYWGDVGSRDQRIVEAADVARVLWLTREYIWRTLSNDERIEVRAWLLNAANQLTPLTNWMLFPVVINLTLASLDGERESPLLRARAHEIFSRYKQLYLDHGWFNDPPHGVDFYNTWGIPYELFWIHTLDPTFDSPFIPEALRQSADLTQHLISPRGIPILGRSVCYRTAVPVPLIAATLIEGESFPPGRAIHALDMVWQYFIAHDSLRDGALTQGYFTADLRLLDTYSGTGSCHWGLRSLVLALMHPANDAFWNATAQPLPVEISDYRLELPRLGWIVEGKQENGEIVITVPRNPGRITSIDDQSGWMKLAELLIGKPVRPPNTAVKYDSRYYSSATPFPLMQ